VARVQLAKMDAGILDKTRALKKRLLACLDAPVNYRLQHVDDPEGDCGISMALIALDKQRAERMCALMAEHGLELEPAYKEDTPDRHIYAYWDAILNKVSASPTGYPWKDPNYKGNAQYSKDMCAQTLDILSRTLRFGINLSMTERNMEEVAAVINWADRNV